MNTIYSKNHLNLPNEKKEKFFTCIKTEKTLPVTEYSEGGHSVIETTGSTQRRRKR
ncbi:hypothetical protein [Sulfurovum mangrovi]|uniref:hypothetical protein n=1 Tax=Sulfurovum mangrovi TaxID=2893889 RepID=UPI001E5E0D6D|nr:hypothetical protein [Sulfurovum mangrovi]UFH60126.1 hypothetical protein LN246_04590 [Sulfurovum mangrovi]